MKNQNEEIFKHFEKMLRLLDETLQNMISKTEFEKMFEKLKEDKIENKISTKDKVFWMFFGVSSFFLFLFLVFFILNFTK